MPNFVDNTKECWGRDRSIIVTPHKYHIKVKCLKVDITEEFQQTITLEKHFSLLIFYEKSGFESLKMITKSLSAKNNEPLRDMYPLM